MRTLRQIFLGMLLAVSVAAFPQRPAYSKMSAFVREAARDAQSSVPLRAGAAAHGVNKERRLLTAFVRVDGDGERILREHGCRSLAAFGDIHIASIPLSALAELSCDVRVGRIESNRSCSVQLDMTADRLGALPVYEGTGLPAAYTGEGVVVGVQDIGFDLTHPTFYSADLSNYRIKALWDQLSTDTVGSSLYVGRDYVGASQLLQQKHSRDGLDQTHGTHTAGIAAGSGYDSPYRGIAFGSDICLVANATSEDIALIDTADYYKYTYATDALGFKYMFDYADAHGMPCVVNFSEGSSMDFMGYDNLYYEILESLTGPGHIIVSSAGNNGALVNYFHKAADADSTGAFVHRGASRLGWSLKSADDFAMRLKWYGETVAVHTIATGDVLATTDSTLTDTVTVDSVAYRIEVAAYPSSFNDAELVYDVTVIAPHGVKMGYLLPFSVEAVGRGADVECYVSSGNIYESDADPSLNAGIAYANINSPSSAPSVICVGATGYRPTVTNYLGQTMQYEQVTPGMRSRYSSVGPTFDGRIKPDVMAPGTNIVSAYSSFYLENHPQANDINWDVAHFEVGGRTYAWNANSGTSMSSPVVTGAVALWLQADPSLTPEQIKEVFSKTCTHCDTSLTYPNNAYGYGEIDIYNGLVEVLKQQAAGLSELSGHQPRAARLSWSDGELAVALPQPAAASLSVRVYSVSGTLVASRQFPAGADTYRLPLSGLPQGVYAVQLCSSDPSLSGSTLIRMP